MDSGRPRRLPLEPLPMLAERVDHLTAAVQRVLHSTHARDPVTTRDRVLIIQDTFHRFFDRSSELCQRLEREGRVQDHHRAEAVRRSITQAVRTEITSANAILHEVNQETFALSTFGSRSTAGSSYSSAATYTERTPSVV